MDYAELRIDHIREEEEKSLVTAWLLDKGFESFVEEEDALLAYIPLENMDEAWISEDIPLAEGTKVSWKAIKEQNWNETWERDYQPVLIEGRCLVRAPFHEPAPDVEYDIVIMPKMSFGTAHHDTTALMIRKLLELDVRSLTVLDMGCGTAVLAILAMLKGAEKVMAIDNDRWAYENALENVKRNDCSEIEVMEGDASLLRGKAYDIILANINRNILSRDIPEYANTMNEGGTLLLSGFYQDDLELIKKKAQAHELRFVDSLTRNDWVAAKFIYKK